jgi:hypothetical protein
VELVLQKVRLILGRILQVHHVVRASFTARMSSSSFKLSLWIAVLRVLELEDHQEGDSQLVPVFMAASGCRKT